MAKENANSEFYESRLLSESIRLFATNPHRCKAIICADNYTYAFLYVILYQKQTRVLAATSPAAKTNEIKYTGDEKIRRSEVKCKYKSPIGATEGVFKRVRTMNLFAQISCLPTLQTRSFQYYDHPVKTFYGLFPISTLEAKAVSLEELTVLCVTVKHLEQPVG